VVLEPETEGAPDVKAVHLEDSRVEIKNVSRPRRPHRFSLIRLLAGGICNTDLELQRGYYGFRGTPGHEFVGEVLESDDASLVGRRVVGEINLACGKCDWCARELGRHCPRRTVLGIVRHPGAFSEFFTLPDRNLHVLPDRISTETAVFTEPLAAACEILDQVRIPKGASVGVLGDGKLGLLIGQVLHAHGLHVVHFGRHPSKLRIASRAGIEARRSKPRMPAAAFDWVVDATGSPEGLRTAVHMTRPRGTVILKSTVHGLAPVDTAPVIVNEITLVGSRCGRMEAALNLLKKRAISLDGMISNRFPLSSAADAFKRADEPGVLKVLLT
jgi:alcohol dehydrogenase